MYKLCNNIVFIVNSNMGIYYVDTIGNQKQLDNILNFNFKLLIHSNSNSIILIEYLCYQ